MHDNALTRQAAQGQETRQRGSGATSALGQARGRAKRGCSGAGTPMTLGSLSHYLTVLMCTRAVPSVASLPWVLSGVRVESTRLILRFTSALSHKECEYNRTRESRRVAPEVAPLKQLASSAISMMQNVVSRQTQQRPRKAHPSIRRCAKGFRRRGSEECGCAL